MSAVPSAVASAVALPSQLSLSWTPSSGTVTLSRRHKKSIKQIKSSQSNEKVHLHLFTNHKSAAISDELNYEDSEKRLIILFSIIALCFLICAISFLGCLHFLFLLAVGC